MNTNDRAKQIAAQVTGFLTAFLLFLGSINVKFEWFTMDSINAVSVVIIAAVPLGVTLYTIYKNFYGFTKRAIIQWQTLRRNNLK